MIDLLLAFRILLSAIAMHYFYRTWRLCKHKGLLVLAVQPCGAISVQLLIGFKMIDSTAFPTTLIYNIIVIITCFLGALGAHLIYSEFNKAYQEGRYAAENSP